MSEDDESRFEPPAYWGADVHVRRGGRFRQEVVLEAGAVELWQSWLAKPLPKEDEIVGDPGTDRVLVEAFLATRGGEATPLGAAVAAMLIQAGIGWGQPGRELLWQLADAWVQEHGLAFAVRAAGAGAGVSCVHNGVRPVLRLRTNPAESGSIYHYPYLHRLRSILAAASDADYDEAVSALAGCRDTLYAKQIASYLVPTRKDWSDELLAEVAPVDDYRFEVDSLLLSLSTAEQVAAVGEMVFWKLQSPDVRYTLADALGTTIAPSVARALDANPNGGDDRKALLKFLGELPSDEAFRAMIVRLGQKHVQPALMIAVKRYPRRAIRLLAAAAASKSKVAAESDFLLRSHVMAHRELAGEMAPGLPDEPRAMLERALQGEDRLPEADSASLPRILAEPPWIGKREKRKEIVLKGLEAPGARKLEWTPGEQETWATQGKYDAYRTEQDRKNWSYTQARYESGRLPTRDESSLFLAGPEKWVRAKLPSWRPEVTWLGERWGRVLLARYELDAYPLALYLAAGNPGQQGDLLLPVVSAEVAGIMADWLVRLKTRRPTALEWLTRHAADAPALLVPDALGPAGAKRRSAEAALRVLASQGHEKDVLVAAADYGPAAAEAIAATLAADPLDVLPARIPQPGAWLDLAVLPQIRVRGGEQALSEVSAGHVVTMLALSKPDEVYPGVAFVREACDPGSLARFTWAVFQRWQGAGFPAKDGWVLTALALHGDDDVVRELSPLIRAWPGEGGHARAVAALDVLSGIGTDTALTHLNSIAQKVKFKALKQRAQEKIEAVAEGLGLTADQLADRLVPDFGLDEAATAVIDYGTRRFVVGFDEQLRPFVTDEDGKPRKALPKPGAKDQTELAEAEYKRFANLKKDVRTIAGDQISRLETAMVMARRWPVDEFERLLVGHPLLRHIVRRLVWTAGDGLCFRIAEDGTYADAADDVFVLPAGAEVGVAHPLVLGETLATWSEVFADYEILQPFPQLGRPVAALDESERTAEHLKRFEGVTAPVGKLLGLTKRGWVRGEPMDNGVENWILRPVPGGGKVVVELDPGIAIGAVSEFPEQTMTSVWLNEPGGHPWRQEGSRKFGELDAVTASELVSELIGLTR